LVGDGPDLALPQELHASPRVAEGHAYHIAAAALLEGLIDGHLGAVVGADDALEFSPEAGNPSGGQLMGSCDIQVRGLFVQQTHPRRCLSQLRDRSPGPGIVRRAAGEMLHDAVSALPSHLFGEEIREQAGLAPVVGARPGHDVFEALGVGDRIAGYDRDAGLVDLPVPLRAALHVSRHQDDHIRGFRDRPLDEPRLLLEIPVGVLYLQLDPISLGYFRHAGGKFGEIGVRHLPVQKYYMLSLSAVARGLGDVDLFRPPAGVLVVIPMPLVRFRVGKRLFGAGRNSLLARLPEDVLHGVLPGSRREWAHSNLLLNDHTLGKISL